MATQIEHDLERIVTAIERVITTVQAGNIDKVVGQLEDIKDEINISLLTMEGYSIEEAEEIVY